MNKRSLKIGMTAAAILLLLLGALAYSQLGVGSGVAKAEASPYAGMSPIQKKILSGFLSSEFDAHIASSNRATKTHSNYFPNPNSDDGCPVNRGSNIKVNQNCLNLTDADLQGRGQANNETSIAIDPNNSNHIVASDSDYRRGDGNCYGAFSLSAGQTWGDTTVPMGFTRGTPFGGVARQYWQAGGDTSVAWDTKGNAYMDCQVFMRGPGVTNNPDQSSAVYMFRSTKNSGASWNFPGRPVVEAFVTGTASGLPLEDKPYMTVDNHKGSPFQDRVYVTWTLFAADGTAYIYEEHSADYGESFSAPVLVSKSSSLCTNTYGLPTPNGPCNENQDSQPFTGPDGSLYVVYTNYNNPVSGPTDNHNQMLIVKSSDGGATFGTPVLVSNFYDLPDCATYQGGLDAGRLCVPEKGPTNNSIFRANNYASGAVNPKNGNVVVTLGSYINKNSNEKNGCIPAGFSALGTNLYTGVKTPGACNNDILVSVSTNGGASFTGISTDPRKLTSITSTGKQKTTDQFWQWADYSNTGKFAVSYYDRQYNQDEFNGYSDVSLSGVSHWNWNWGFNTVRVTSGSMPLPTQFPDVNGASVFYGDYTGLAAVGNVAYPIWMDTRGKDRFLCPGTGAPGVPPAVCSLTQPNGVVANDQDIFVSAVQIP